MTYDLVTIRSGGDGDDDRLYPALSDVGSSCPPLLSPEDGRPRRLAAKALQVQRSSDGRAREVVALPSWPVNVWVTDARVAISCERYDTAKRWAGFGAGAALALAANGVSRAVALQPPGWARATRFPRPHLRHPGGRAGGRRGRRSAVRLHMMPTSYPAVESTASYRSSR